jgi:membrane protein
MRLLTVLRAALASLWREGFSHAGNLAYLSLLALLPFFVLVASAAGALGRTGIGSRLVQTVLEAVPPDVAALLRAPAREVIERPASGGLVTLGILLVLWTVTTYAEAVRDIIRRAHGAEKRMPVWRYRLRSLAVVVAGVLLMIVSLAGQFILTGAETFMRELMPSGADMVAGLGFNRLLPVAALFLGLALAFAGLTPKHLRKLGWIWPGALVTTLLWIGATRAMPLALGMVSSNSIAYGSLSGVIVTLLFFWVLGLCLAFGAHFNAALANAGKTRLKDEASNSG